MPYTASTVPSYVPKGKAKRWAAIWNSAYDQKIKDGKTNEEAETYAFSVASGVAGSRAKKLFKFGTALTGFTNGVFGPFECGHCMFFDQVGDFSICHNSEIAEDPDVPTDEYGNKLVEFQDCCNEYTPVNLSKGLDMLEKATTMDKSIDEVRIFCPLVKVDAKKREVWGVVTAENPDRDNEICDYESTVPYYKQLVSEMSKATDGANIFPLRAMHGLIAAGKGIGIEFRTEAKQIFMGFKVVDDIEWKKVEESVYTGFSQGGRYIKKWKDGEYQRYTAQPSEVSLVDIPCLPTATFEYVKADGSSEMRKFRKAEDLGQKEGEIPSSTQTPTGDVSGGCACACTSCVAGKCTDCASGEKCQMCMAGKAAKKVQYLVVEKNGKGHLPYTKEDGKVDRRLMRAAWAALFSDGKYEGPDKEKAKKKLKQLYAREGLDNPTEKAEVIDGLLKSWTEEAINNRAYGMLGKGMYSISRFAELVESMKFLWLSISYEEEIEGDESEASASVDGVKEAYSLMLDNLLAYTEEQIAEERAHPKLSNG
jgi:hypothetical protein